MRYVAASRLRISSLYRIYAPRLRARLPASSLIYVIALAEIVIPISACHDWEGGREMTLILWRYSGEGKT